MHSTVLECLRLARCGQLHPYALSERRHGNSTLAGEGVHDLSSSGCAGFASVSELIRNVPFPHSQEMIKGVRIAGTGKTLSYLDTLVVPIIENTPNEEDLKDSMAEAMKENPNAAAILARRHGIYVWGLDWEKAKTQTECLDYLFEIGVKMKLAGLATSLNE